MFCGTTARVSQPILIQNNKGLVKTKETMSACNNFDPFSSSPPSNFIRNLNERRKIYHEMVIPKTTFGYCK